MLRTVVVGVISALALAAPAFGLDLGANGSAGPLVVTADTTIHLENAIMAPWDTSASPADAASGYYDPQKWAVVFHYSSVDIQAGTCRFSNHPSGAPVVWLVSGDVTIAPGAVVDVSGKDGKAGVFIDGAEAGPGGFRGGIPYESATQPAGSGMGPGGGGTTTGNSVSGDGSYGTGGTHGPTAVYGNARIMPLIGGSGGGGNGDGTSGGAGGGAILIAAQGTITVGGAIQALGGVASSGVSSRAGEGSGGAIKLVAGACAVSGTLKATTPLYGHGGKGRIYVEADSFVEDPGATLDPNCNSLVPVDTTVSPIWPESTHPTVRVVSIGGNPISPDPRADMVLSGDVVVNTESAVPVVLEASYVPQGWTVELRLVQKTGPSVWLTATPGAWTLPLSQWTVDLPPLTTSRFNAVQARAHP